MNDNLKELIDRRLSAVTVGEDLKNKILGRKQTKRIIRKRLMPVAAVLLMFAFLTAAAYGQYGSIENFSKVMGRDYTYAQDMLAGVEVNSVTSEKGTLTAEVVGVLKGGGELRVIVNVKRTDGKTFPATMDSGKYGAGMLWAKEDENGKLTGACMFVADEQEIDASELMLDVAGYSGMLPHPKESDTLTFDMGLSCRGGYMGNRVKIRIGKFKTWITAGTAAEIGRKETVCDDIVTLKMTVRSNFKPLYLEAADNSAQIRYIKATPVGLAVYSENITGGDSFDNGLKLRVLLSNGNSVLLDKPTSNGGFSSNKRYGITYVVFDDAVNFNDITAVEWNGEKIALTRTSGLAKLIDDMSD